MLISIKANLTVLSNINLYSEEVGIMLICITGVDGCGKGTQVSLLQTALENLGLGVFLSKAYGDAEKESLAHFFQYWDDMTITLVFQGLFRQQYVNAEKALKKGEIVIADRWDESYWAYHTQFGILAQHADLRKCLHGLAFNGRVPDLVFLLDVLVETAERRMMARGKDFFDAKDMEYHSKMQSGYLSLAKQRNWLILDGAKTPNEIHHEILEIVLKVLKRA